MLQAGPPQVLQRQKMHESHGLWTRRLPSASRALRTDDVAAVPLRGSQTSQWRQKHRQRQNFRHASDSRDTQGKAVGAQEQTRGQRQLLGEGDVVISFKGYSQISQVKKEGWAQGLWDSPDRRPASAKAPRSEEWESARGRGP